MKTMNNEGLNVAFRKFEGIIKIIFFEGLEK